MLSNERKNELDVFMEHYTCASDSYYLNMEQNDFDTCMEHAIKEEFYKGYCRQREIGFDKYQQEAVEQFAKITSSEELHYLISDYNYDDGIFIVEQIVMNPACDIITAKMVYWLLQPDYYYEEYGSLSKCPQDATNYDDAALLIKMEERATANSFQTGLVWNDELTGEQPDGLDFSQKPFCHVPKAFR